MPGFRERERFANESAKPLAKGSVETLDVIGFT